MPSINLDGLRKENINSNSQISPIFRAHLQNQNIGIWKLKNYISYGWSSYSSPIFLKKLCSKSQNINSKFRIDFFSLIKSNFLCKQWPWAMPSVSSLGSYLAERFTMILILTIVIWQSLEILSSISTAYDQKKRIIKWWNKFVLRCAFYLSS